MTEKPINELIDDYVTGQISPDEKIYLEELAAIDPEVAGQLHSAKVAYDFLERSYYRNVKKKLQEYDRSIEMKEGLSSKKMVRLAAIGIIIVAIFWMISYWYFQPAHLAKRFYHPMEEQMRQVADDPVSQLKMKADKAFFENDFTEAGTTFQLIIIKSEDPDRMHAEWNTLLCELAINGITSGWRYKLDEIIGGSDEPEKGRAIKLKKQLNSWIYRLTFLQFAQEFSSLKPRLI